MLGQQRGTDNAPHPQTAEEVSTAMLRAKEDAERQRNDEKRIHAMSGRRDPGVLSPEGWDRGSKTRQLEEGSNRRKHLQEGSRAMDGT